MNLSRQDFQINHPYVMSEIPYDAAVSQVPMHITLHQSFEKFLVIKFFFLI